MSRMDQALWWLDNLDRPTAQAVLETLSHDWQRVTEIRRHVNSGSVYPILSALLMDGTVEKRGSKVEQYRLVRKPAVRTEGGGPEQGLGLPLKGFSPSVPTSAGPTAPPGDVTDGAQLAREAAARYTKPPRWRDPLPDRFVWQDPKA